MCPDLFDPFTAVEDEVMAGVFLDAQMHSLARHLVSVDHRVDLDKEISHLNNEYGFVPQEQFRAFRDDLRQLYEFEKTREVTKIDQVAFAKFKLDKVMGKASFEQHDAQLSAELAAT